MVLMNIYIFWKKRLHSTLELFMKREAVIYLKTLETIERLFGKPAYSERATFKTECS